MQNLRLLHPETRCQNEEKEGTNYFDSLTEITR